MATIADILHEAADEWLACSLGDYDLGGKTKYSCNAIVEALYDTVYDIEPMYNRIMEGLENMGLDTESASVFIKLGYPDYSWEVFEETQGARYMWLKFAALIAEEQGV